MERCKGRSLSLNSTKAAYPLYLSLGFVKEATVFLHRGTVSELPGLAPTDGTLAELPAAQIDEITACDTQAFGVNRANVLAQLSEKSVTCVLRRNDEVVARTDRADRDRQCVAFSALPSHDDCGGRNAHRFVPGNRFDCIVRW